MTDRDDLRLLVAGSFPLITIESCEEPRVIEMLRSLASRLDAPGGMNPADFAAARAALLLRMGEGEAARALVQDIDAGNYTPALTQTAVDAFAFTADIDGEPTQA